MRRISIFDSTLRDGEQAPGNAMLPERKLDIALAIEALGVDVIESGFPGSSPSDCRATELIANALTSARVATLSRASEEDVRLAVEAGGTERHHVQILATASEAHLAHKRGISRAEAVREVADAVGYARALGVDQVTLGLEDASRGSDELLRELVTEGQAAGVTLVTVADTTGCMTPAELSALIRRIRSWTAPEVMVSVHCHEDMGLSLANALAAIEAGADEVQACLAGIGERAGNTALEELIAVLTYKGESMNVTTSARPEGLQTAFDLLRETIGLPVPRNKAIFGENAFATQAGIHQSGLLRDPVTYEYIEPFRFGRERSILIGRHSGRAVLRHVLKDMGLPADGELMESVYQEHIANRADGNCLGLATIRQLIAAKSDAAVPAIS